MEGVCREYLDMIYVCMYTRYVAKIKIYKDKTQDGVW